MLLLQGVSVQVTASHTAYLGWPQHLVMLVQHDHPVLLPTDAHTLHTRCINLRQGLSSCLESALCAAMQGLNQSQSCRLELLLQTASRIAQQSCKCALQQLNAAGCGLCAPHPVGACAAYGPCKIRYCSRQLGGFLWLTSTHVLGFCSALPGMLVSRILQGWDPLLTTFRELPSYTTALTP